MDYICPLIIWKFKPDFNPKNKFELIDSKLPYYRPLRLTSDYVQMLKVLGWRKTAKEKTLCEFAIIFIASSRLGETIWLSQWKLSQLSGSTFSGAVQAGSDHCVCEWIYHSNESHWAVLCCGAVYCAVQGGSKTLVPSVSTGAQMT